MDKRFLNGDGNSDEAVSSYASVTPYQAAGTDEAVSYGEDPYVQRSEGRSNLEETAHEQFGKPVFPPLTQVKLGPLNKSWQTTTFYESLVTIETSSKLACLPKQSSRIIIPKHRLTAVSFAHATNQGYIYRLISNLLVPCAVLIFWSGIWGLCLYAMISAAQGGGDSSDSYDPTPAPTKDQTGQAVWWGLCTFLFIPLCFCGCCIGQWVGFQYCKKEALSLPPSLSLSLSYITPSLFYRYGPQRHALRGARCNR